MSNEKENMLNQKGFVTIDFIFALVLAVGMSAVVFAITYTLSVVEVTQYIMFATARAHAVGDVTVEAQQQAAKDKYTLLTSSKELLSLYKNGWFILPKADALDIRSGNNGSNFEEEYPSIGPTISPNKIGVRAQMQVKLLELSIPFLGAVASENGFKTNIGALLVREPSQAECINFMNLRMQCLWGATPGGQASATGCASFSQFQSFQGQSLKSISTAWEDNGC